MAIEKQDSIVVNIGKVFWWKNCQDKKPKRSKLSMGGKGSSGKIGNKGGGRNPSPAPKDDQIGVRLNESQLAWVKAKAEQCGKKPTAWVRDVIDALRAVEGQEEEMWGYFFLLIYRNLKKEN